MMTSEHPSWNEFIDRLDGPDGCNFRKEDGKIVWNCSSVGHEHSERILATMGLTEVEIADSIEYFKQHGGYCDCEILFNVNRVN